jgi:hypothetical protein
MGLHHKDVLREILGLSRKNWLWVASGASGHAGVELGENGSVTPTS